MIRRREKKTSIKKSTFVDLPCAPREPYDGCLRMVVVRPRGGGAVGAAEVRSDALRLFLEISPVTSQCTGCSLVCVDARAQVGHAARAHTLALCTERSGCVRALRLLLDRRRAFVCYRWSPKIRATDCGFFFQKSLIRVHDVRPSRRPRRALARTTASCGFVLCSGTGSLTTRGAPMLRGARISP